MKNNEKQWKTHGKPMENKGKQWNITCGASPALMHHWFDHHHYIWHPWVIPFSKIWHMLGLFSHFVFVFVFASVFVIVITFSSSAVFIFDILESYYFWKYGTCWVFSHFVFVFVFVFVKCNAIFLFVYIYLSQSK